jgi:hypothetical protein
VSAFLLAGHIPFVLDWAEFVDYFRRMRDFGIVESIRDFCYTPLTVRRAAYEASTATTASRPAASVTPAEIVDPYGGPKKVCAADSDADWLRARRSE